MVLNACFGGFTKMFKLDYKLNLKYNYKRETAMHTNYKEQQKKLHTN